MTNNGWGQVTLEHCWRGAPAPEVQRLGSGTLLARHPNSSSATGARLPKPSGASGACRPCAPQNLLMNISSRFVSLIRLVSILSQPIFIFGYRIHVPKNILKNNSKNWHDYLKKLINPILIQEWKKIQEHKSITSNLQLFRMKLRWN